jgi:CheY-like chemotaxis protein
LVVEDDINLNRVFCKYLTAAGYEVESVYSRAAAIDFLAYGTAPDAVVVDFELCDGNSVPILRLLEQPEYKHIKVVVCSGNAFSHRYDINEARVNQFLLKPVSPRSLSLLMKSLVPLHAPVETAAPKLNTAFA